jgi:tetratricopeptide (TPR) repeat protein
LVHVDRDAPEVEQLLDEAGRGDGVQAERILLRAHALAPRSLTVLLGLYRHYTGRSRYERARAVAERALTETAARLGIERDWRRLGERDLATGVYRSMSLFRLHLGLVKALGYIELCAGRPLEALARFKVVARLDRADRMNVRNLIYLASEALGEQPRAALA